MEKSRHTLIFWFVSERQPRTLEMQAAGPWTQGEAVQAIQAKLMGGDSGRRRCRLVFHEFAPPVVGAVMPDDIWLRPSHVYYVRRLPPAPPTTYEEDHSSRKRGMGRYRRQGQYMPYGPYMPVLKGLHCRV